MSIFSRGFSILDVEKPEFYASVLGDRLSVSIVQRLCAGQVNLR